MRLTPTFAAHRTPVYIFLGEYEGADSEAGTKALAFFHETPTSGVSGAEALRALRDGSGLRGQLRKRASCGAGWAAAGGAPVACAAGAGGRRREGPGSVRRAGAAADT